MITRSQPERAMRRPHVYERSAPRSRREGHAATGGDPGQAARAMLRTLEALTLAADEAGLVRLADLLDAAWAEAERVGAGPAPASP